MSFKRKSIYFPAFLSLLAVMALLLFAGDTSPIEQILPETSKMCGECHEEVYASFMGNVHARLREFEFRGTLGGCEACHGPAQKHLDSNEVSDIYSFGVRSPETDNTRCIRCHFDGDFAAWSHGSHARNGLACSECHTIHKGKGKAPKNELELCSRCHSDVRSRMFFPSHHPVREGKMSCSDCHNVHGDVAMNSLRTTESRNDLCLNCHSRYQGPFIFEHPPVVEDCMTCHEPHGTAANNLLKQNEPFLCLQCHTMHFHAAKIGDEGPVTGPSGSVTNRFGQYGFVQAFGKKCTQCHTRIHGSDLPSQGTTSRGGSLTR